MGRALDFVYPRICLHCDRTIRQDSLLRLCASCQGYIEPDIQRQRGDELEITSLYPYNSPLFSLLKAWKYSRDRQAGQQVLHYWKAGLDRLPPSYLGNQTTVTWVPMFPLKQIYRGWHPARDLARSTGAFSMALLHRWWPVRSQAGKKRKDRLQASAFGIVASDRKCHEILLVDDIVTTGRTITLCAEILQPMCEGDLRAVTLLRADTQ